MSEFVFIASAGAIIYILSFIISSAISDISNNNDNGGN